MSPLEPEVPPVGEEIHLPGPSVLPVLTARRHHAAADRPHDVPRSCRSIGGVLTIGCVVRWIKDTRHELDELPLDADER